MQFLSVSLVILVTIEMFTVTSNSFVNGRSINQSSLGYLRRKMKTHLKTPGVCKTKGCRKVAKMIRNNMDLTVDPCEDFYYFACGNYHKTVKPEEKIYSSVATRSDRIMKKKLRSIFKSKRHGNELRPFQMARDLYKICLRGEVGRNQDVLPLLKKAGGWPVVEGKNWKEKNFKWDNTVIKLRNLSLEAKLFHAVIGYDIYNSSRSIIYITQINSKILALLGKTMIIGRTDIAVKAYRSFMVDIAVMFGASRGSAEREFSDVMNFVTEISAISLKVQELRDPMKRYNPMTIKELQSKYPVVKNWLRYLTKYFHNVIRFKHTEVINLLTPLYFERLQKLLGKTEKRTIANFLMWEAVLSLTMLTREMRDRYDNFTKIFSGSQKKVPKWKKCITFTSSKLKFAVSAMYVRNFITMDVKKAVTEIVENIRQQMINVLKTTNWMDEVTRLKAMEKARAMNEIVAYPDELLQDDKLEKYYEKLNINATSSLLEATLQINKVSVNYMSARFHEDVKKPDWIIHGDIIDFNAYYNPQENCFALKASLLQNTFFSLDWPKYVYYGSIGFIIGHEMTHGFDSMGSEFDKFGNMVDWWKQETKDEFRKRMQCVIDEANNYTVKSVNMTLNGVHTKSENVADIGGAKLAEMAYKSWAESTGRKEPRLAGLESFTPRQIFWLSIANTHCVSIHDTFVRWAIVNDVHSPSEYRVNNFVRNHKTFAKDFNCPVGSKMNPCRKCKVW